MHTMVLVLVYNQHSHKVIICVLKVKQSIVKIYILLEAVLIQELEYRLSYYLLVLLYRNYSMTIKELYLIMNKKVEENLKMNRNQVESDFLYCESIIKRNSKSFYYAFSQLPEDKAKAVYVIYAFCRIADDSVDENDEPVERAKALSRLKYELDLFSRNEELDKPLWRALRYVFDHYHMDIQPFYDQLTGQSMDVNFVSPKNLSELERYSYYVAGSVGLMLLPVIASGKREELTESAINLGV